MPDRVRMRVDGRLLETDAGATVAAALWNEGVRSLRTSVGGEPRGPLCAMGICFECRVAIDGTPHRRACLERVRKGMSVETGGVPSGPPVPETAARTRVLAADVAVVGAGPAGVAAACRAAESGARTVLLDEGLVPGGQIYRRHPDARPPEAARAWIERLARGGADVVAGASVFDAAPAGDGFVLLAEAAGAALRISARRIVLATGARELFLPFPGWTLPGVLGAGAAQALWKSGASLAGRRAVVAGSGPLLLPVAASLASAGARLVLVAEQAGRVALAAFAFGLASRPAMLLEAARYRSRFSGAPYRTAAWIESARGRGKLEAVTVVDGGARHDIECDLLAVGFGLVPNVELARLLGCAVRGGAVEVNEAQATSVDGVFAAGEPCGVAGVDVAIAEGQIAGLAAAGRDPAEPQPIRRRASGRRGAARIARTFAPRPELRTLATADTIVCRCEDARLAAVAACSGAREAKLVTRAGMGACQGRVCGPALGFLFGWDSDTVRPPARPALVGHLAINAD